MIYNRITFICKKALTSYGISKTKKSQLEVRTTGEISSLTLLYPQKIWYLGELRHSLFFTVFSRKRQFDKGRLEPAKKGLHTNRKGRTKHKSHHESKRGNPKFPKKNVSAFIKLG